MIVLTLKSVGKDTNLRFEFNAISSQDLQVQCHECYGSQQNNFLDSYAVGLFSDISKQDQK